MPTYQIKAPDGKTYRIDGPEGATDEQVRAEVMRQNPHLSQSREQRRAAIMAQDPSEYDPTSPAFQAKYGATSGMTTADRFDAGMGKFLNDTARGTGQMLGLVDQQRVDAARERDAPLMQTTAGKVGNIMGGMAFTAPAMLIPGANSAAGASLIGAGTGLLQPTSAGESRTGNAAIGAGAGLAGFGIGKGLSKLFAAPPTGGAGGSSSAAGNASITSGQAAAQSTASGSVNLTGRSGINYGSVGPDPSAGITGPAREVLDVGRSMGLRTTPGRATGSKMLQQMEAKLASQPMTGGRFAAIDKNNAGILNRVAAKAIGENADTMDAGTIDSAFRRLGTVFDDAGDDAARKINPDDFVSKLSTIENESQGLLSGLKSVVEHPLVRDLYNLAARGQATGQQLANLSSKLGKAVDSQMRSAGGDRALGAALADVKELADDMLTSGMSGERLSKLMDARKQYRTLIQMVGNQGVVDPTTGNVSGATLANVLQRGDRYGFTRGNNQSDLYNAARFSRAFRDTIGNSGTATRMPMNTVEMAASIPFNLAARAYTSSPAVNLALKAQAASRAAQGAMSPVMDPLLSGANRLFGPVSPYLPAAGGLFGSSYATQ